MSKAETNRQKKLHRDRKNPHAAEVFKKQKHERNVARGKQVFDLEFGYRHVVESPVVKETNNGFGPLAIRQ